MSDEKINDIIGESSSSIPVVTDCSDEVFKNWLKNAALGDVYSVHNLLQASFEQLNNVRKDTMNEIQKLNGLDQDSSGLVDFLKTKVYPMLHRIETRVFECKDRLKEIEKPLPTVVDTNKNGT